MFLKLTLAIKDFYKWVYHHLDDYHAAEEEAERAQALIDIDMPYFN